MEETVSPGSSHLTVPYKRFGSLSLVSTPVKQLIRVQVLPGPLRCPGVTGTQMTRARKC